MGLTYATTQLFNLAKTGAPYTAEFLVDTGAIDCMAPASELQKLGVDAEKISDYELADGTRVSYPVGYARVTFIGLETVVPIIFGPDECEPILGVLALEGAGVGVDPISKNLKIMSSKPLKFMRENLARNYTAVIERCPQTKFYVGYVPGFTGAHSQGETLEELQGNLREVIQMLLEDGEPEMETEFVGTQAVMV